MEDPNITTDDVTQKKSAGSDGIKPLIENPWK